LARIGISTSLVIISNHMPKFFSCCFLISEVKIHLLRGYAIDCMVKEEHLKEMLEKAGKLQREIVKEINNIQNAGTLPRDLHKKMNLIKSGVTELIREINNKIYRQTTLSDYTTDE